MVALLAIQGVFVLLLLILIARWLDVRTLRAVAMLALIFEFCIIITSTSLALTTACASYVSLGGPVSSLAAVDLEFVLVFDSISGAFISILIAALVLCYVFLIEYFEYDESSVQIILLSATFSQLALVFFCAGDIVSMIFLWEWISLVSFFLVRHWSMRVATLKAGLKVFIISQLGDYLFILSLASLAVTAGSSSIATILTVLRYTCEPLVAGFFQISQLALQLFGLLSAVLLKSAQLVFYPWLLDAMEAPVPISAQLHSSTLVIIGFYVFFRFVDFIYMFPLANSILIVSGTMTAVLASVLGFMQDDGKRLLACSTASQLGYVITALGCDAVVEAMILLVFCCINKAYTFVFFGAVMERHAGISDFRLFSLAHTFVAERAGLITALANTTVAPAAFAWHVKSTLSRGQLLLPAAMQQAYAVEVLSLTWALSTLYLLHLCLNVFCKRSRRPVTSTSTVTTCSYVQSAVDWALSRHASRTNWLTFVIKTTTLCIILGLGWFVTLAGISVTLGSLSVAAVQI